MFCKTEKSMSY